MNTVRTPHGRAAALVGGVLILLAALAAWGPTWAPGEAWGVNAARFLRPGLVAALVATALLAPFVVAAIAWRARDHARGPVVALAVVAWGALLWRFRVAHVLLGDGIPITTRLPEQHELHPREPLASWLLQQAWRILGTGTSAPGPAREQAVARVAALVSVAAGIVFAAGAVAFARECLRSFGGDGDEGDAPAAALLVATLLAQGATLVFFGYVEHYAWPAAGALWLSWALLRAVRGVAPFALPLAVFAACFSLHFSSLVFAPALAVVFVAAVVRRASRAVAARDALLGAIATAAATALRAHGYDLVANVRDLIASQSAGPAYLFSHEHVRDFANEHARLGPLALPLFGVLAVPLALASRVPVATRSLLLVGGGAIVAATWRTPDMPLGYARDWDVFAAAGLALTAFALAAFLASVRVAATRRWLLGGALCVSLLHTLPWIALNHDERASVERFATLPLGLGRTESTLAWWHLQRREFGEARTWIERSLRVNPDNIRAVDLYGRAALLEGRPEFAVRAYRWGVSMRPDRPEYRLQLAWALQSCGRPGEALAALDTLERTHPDDPALWLQRAVGLEALGRRDSARACLARALHLSPGLAGTARQVLPTLRETP